MAETGDENGLWADPALRRFIDEEVLPGTGVAAVHFWTGLERLLRALTPENRRLLAMVRQQQSLIDKLERENPGISSVMRDDSGAILLDV